MTTTLVGTTSNDTMIGGSGADTLSGGTGSDFLNGGSGSDILDGGEGADRLLGGSGSDTLIYRAWENLSGASSYTSYDVYNGGTGAVQRGSALPDLDRLHIYLSEAQLDDPIFMAAFNADMCEYEAFLVAQTNPNTLQAGQTEFTFNSINLKVSAIEKVAVVKAGQTHDFLETDEAQSATGSLTSGGSAAFVAGSQSSHLGTFTVDAGGAWTFVMNDAHDHLADSETEGAIFNVLAEDGSTVNVTIVLTGTNDAPVLTIADTVAAVTEDVGVVPGQLADSGALSFTDADQTDLVTISSAYNGDAVWSGGSLSPAQLAAVSAGFSADSNSWDYSVANSALQFLAAGETITLSFTVTATDDLDGPLNDDDSEVVTLTITGTNDAPVLTIADTVAAVTEDVGVVPGQLADSGALSFTDADQTDLVTISSAYNGDAVWSGGSLSPAQLAAVSAGFSADSNSWDYSVANAALQFLAAGETITLSFTVTATDDSARSTMTTARSSP